MRYIALDASSTTIGWCLGEDEKPVFWGTKKLEGDLSARMLSAHQFTHELIQTWGLARVAIEAPAFAFKGSGIPQVRVSGAILLAVIMRDLPWRDVSPSMVKLSIAGTGKASKLQVVQAVAVPMGYNPEELTFRGSKSSARAYLGKQLLYDDNCADSVALALTVMRKEDLVWPISER